MPVQNCGRREDETVSGSRGRRVALLLLQTVGTKARAGVSGTLAAQLWGPWTPGEWLDPAGECRAWGRLSQNDCRERAGFGGTGGNFCPELWNDQGKRGAGLRWRAALSRWAEEREGLLLQDGVGRGIQRRPPLHPLQISG